MNEDFDKDKGWDYDKIMSDRKIFDKTVYTPLSEAIEILKKRQKDTNLIQKIEKLLNNDIPKPLQKIDLCGVSEKQVATPSHDTRWFVELMKDNGLKAVFAEYHNDKFTSNNGFKHSLGQLHLHDDHNDRKGDNIEEKITIVDFNKYNGKPIKDVTTLWGESLVNFHKRLFEISGIALDGLLFYDASDWLKRNGASADKYYERDLLLYICHGILFENFLLKGSEGDFTKNVFLPAFRKVFELTGEKPLIVPIPPMDEEENAHWVSYSKKIRKHIESI